MNKIPKTHISAHSIEPIHFEDGKSRVVLEISCWLPSEYELERVIEDYLNRDERSRWQRLWDWIRGEL